MYKTKSHLSCDLRRWCRSTLGGAKIEIYHTFLMTSLSAEFNLN